MLFAFCSTEKLTGKVRFVCDKDDGWSDRSPDENS